MALSRWPLFAFGPEHRHDIIHACVRRHLGADVMLVNHVIDGERVYYVLTSQRPDPSLVAQIRSDIARMGSAQPRAPVASREQARTERHGPASGSAAPRNALPGALRGLTLNPQSTAPSSGLDGRTEHRPEPTHTPAARSERHGNVPERRSLNSSERSTLARSQQPAPRAETRYVRHGRTSGSQDTESEPSGSEDSSSEQSDSEITALRSRQTVHQPTPGQAVHQRHAQAVRTERHSPARSTDLRRQTPFPATTRPDSAKTSDHYTATHAEQPFWTRPGGSRDPYGRATSPPKSRTVPDSRERSSKSSALLRESRLHQRPQHKVVDSDRYTTVGVRPPARSTPASSYDPPKPNAVQIEHGVNTGSDTEVSTDSDQARTTSAPRQPATQHDAPRLRVPARLGPRETSERAEPVESDISSTKQVRRLPSTNEGNHPAEDQLQRVSCSQYRGQRDLKQVLARDSLAIGTRLSSMHAFNDLRGRTAALRIRTYILFRLLRLSYRAAQSGGSSDGNQRSITESSQSTQDRSSRKRKCDSGTTRSVRNNGDESCDDDDPNEQRAKRSKSQLSNRARNRLPCPFNVNDPDAYASHKAYPFISKLQTHLQDNHKVYMCSRCLIKLRDKKALVSHQHDPACNSRPCARCLPRGVQLIGSCDCLDTAEQQWTGLYRLCFPNDGFPTHFASCVPAYPQLAGELATWSAAEFAWSATEFDVPSHVKDSMPLTSTTPEIVREEPVSDSNTWHPYTIVNSRSPDTALEIVQASISDLTEQVRQLHETNAQTIGELWCSPKPQLELSSLGDRLAQIERRIEAAEKEAISANLVRAVLDMVWERFKASGHVETQPGGALERLVALVPRPSLAPPPIAPRSHQTDVPSDLYHVEPVSNSHQADVPQDPYRVDSVIASAPSLTICPDNFDFYLNG